MLHCVKAGRTRGKSASTFAEIFPSLRVRVAMGLKVGSRTAAGLQLAESRTADQGSDQSACVSLSDFRVSAPPNQTRSELESNIPCAPVLPIRRTVRA